MAKRFLKVERCSCGAIDRYDESQYGNSRYERCCPTCKKLVMYYAPGKDYVKEFLDILKGSVDFDYAAVKSKPDAKTVERELGMIPSLQIFEHFFSYSFPELSIRAKETEFRIFDIGVSADSMTQLCERRLKENRFLIGKVIEKDREALLVYDDDGAQMCTISDDGLFEGEGIRAFYKTLASLQKQQSAAVVESRL